MTLLPAPSTTDLAPAQDTDAVAAAVATLPALPPPGPGDRYGLAQLTALWLLQLGSDRSRRAYFSDLTLWLAWCERTALDPRHANRADVDAWRATLTVTSPKGEVGPPAPKTLVRRLDAISSWYNYLASNGAADRNPVPRRRGSDAKPRAKVPTLSEAGTAALLDHAITRARRLGSEPAWRDATLVCALFYTGVRLSALLDAEVGDVTEEAGYPVLHHTLKGGARTYVRLLPEVLTPLGSYLSLRAARAGCPVDQLTGRLLVTSPHPYRPESTGGKALVQRDATNTLRTLARQAGLPQAVADRMTAHSGGIQSR